MNQSIPPWTGGWQNYQGADWNPITSNWGRYVSGEAGKRARAIAASHGNLLGQLDYSLYGADENPWIGVIERGIDVAGAVLSRSPYYSPSDPRYQQQTPVYAPTQTAPAGAVRTTVDGAGITLSKDTLMLIAGGILIFLVASRRR